MTAKPDFSGEYILDRAASVLSPHASAMVSARMKLTHADPRLHCSARFASPTDAMEFSFERFTDGRTVPIGVGESTRCHWDGAAIMSEDRTGSGDAATVMTWRYELVDEGKRLRATEWIRGGGRDQDNVWEFERVRPEAGRNK